MVYGLERGTLYIDKFCKPYLQVEMQLIDNLKDKIDNMSKKQYNSNFKKIVDTSS